MFTICIYIMNYRIVHFCFIFGILPEKTAMGASLTAGLLLVGDDDGRPGGFAKPLQRHVETEQVLGVLPRPTIVFTTFGMTTVPHYKHYV